MLNFNPDTPAFYENMCGRTTKKISQYAEKTARRVP
jgi:hypothetical protein